MTTSSPFAVECRGLTKRFGTTIAVEDLDLSIYAGEILALLGPSGCGKTTVLRLIAGFDRPDGGEIILGGKPVASPQKQTPPEKRGVSMVFQDFALFPHLSVIENVAFGLTRRTKAQRQEDAYSMLKLVGLEHQADRQPHELSGGQRQRVALARALAPRPILVLLDEPLSNLDADLRAQLREELRVILKGIQTTAVFVTHDQEEALYIGDRLALMNRGRVEQVGTPEEVFHQPATQFAADFMGHTGFLPGEVTADGIMTEIGLISQRVDLPLGTTVELAVRADDISFEPISKGEALVLARHFKGALNLYRLRLPSGRLLHAYQPHGRIIRPGTPVRVSLTSGHPLACFYQGIAVPSKPI